MHEKPDWGAVDDDLARTLGEAGSQGLAGHLGIEIVELRQGFARLRCQIEQHHFAPNGYLHAGSIVALADTAAGYGCVASLPESASGFTTIEMKTNFLGTMLEGAMVAEASLIHGGRSTQVWDVDVTVEGEERVLAHFRCTQMILYPRA